MLLHPTSQVLLAIVTLGGCLVKGFQQVEGEGKLHIPHRQHCADGGTCSSVFFDSIMCGLKWFEVIQSTWEDGTCAHQAPSCKVPN